VVGVDERSRKISHMKKLSILSERGSGQPTYPSGIGSSTRRKDSNETSIKEAGDG